MLNTTLPKGHGARRHKGKRVMICRLKLLRHITRWCVVWDEQDWGTQLRYRWLIEHGYAYLEWYDGRWEVEITEKGSNKMDEALFDLLIPFWRAWQTNE